MEVHYDKDEDILMLVLTHKKIDDSYETEDGNIVSIDKKGQPVMIDIFHASNFLRDLGKVVPKSVQRDIWPQNVTVAHQIKKGQR